MPGLAAALAELKLRITRQQNKKALLKEPCDAALMNTTSMLEEIKGNWGQRLEACLAHKNRVKHLRNNKPRNKAAAYWGAKLVRLLLQLSRQTFGDAEFAKACIAEAAELRCTRTGKEDRRAREVRPSDVRLALTFVQSHGNPFLLRVAALEAEVTALKARVAELEADSAASALMGMNSLTRKHRADGEWKS